MGKLVYIIEDDPMTQMLLKTMLNQASIESKIFSDFHTAIEEIDKDKKNQNFPVAIFSDFMMPQGDGLDFLHQLREKYTTEQLPFYFITGVQKELIEPFVEKFEYNEILNKPIQSEQIRKIVNSLIEVR